MDENLPSGWTWFRALVVEGPKGAVAWNVGANRWVDAQGKFMSSAGERVKFITVYSRAGATFDDYTNEIWATIKYWNERYQEETAWRVAERYWKVT